MITIDRLRKDHPDWAWQAYKRGIGWYYSGRKSDQEIFISSESVITNADTDEFVTVWFVTDSKTGNKEPYHAWLWKAVEDRLYKERFNKRDKQDQQTRD